jgi:hypothetical protein
VTWKTEEDVGLKEVGYKDGRWMLLVSIGLGGLRKTTKKLNEYSGAVI